MEAIKDKARGGGKRHACPRRGRPAYGVGRSGRSEGEVGRRGVLWQEKSWPRREVRSAPRSSPALLADAATAFGSRPAAARYVCVGGGPRCATCTLSGQPACFFLTLALVRVFAGGLGAGYGLESGVDGG